MTSTTSRARSAGRLALLAALAGWALGGCSPQASRADGPAALAAIGDHLDEVSSSVATARLTLETTVEGRLPAVTADATLGRAVESATAAAHDLAALVPPAADRRAVDARAEALRVAADAVAAVAGARVALGVTGHVAGSITGDRAARDAEAHLDAARAALERARAEVGP